MFRGGVVRVFSGASPGSNWRFGDIGGPTWGSQLARTPLLGQLLLYVTCAQTDLFLGMTLFLSLLPWPTPACSCQLCPTSTCCKPRVTLGLLCLCQSIASLQFPMGFTLYCAPSVQRSRLTQ